MNLEPLPGSELHCFRAGDPHCFRDLLQRYGAAVKGVAASFARDDDDLKDLCQEVWLRVFVKRSTYKGTGPLLAWILTLARRTCVSNERRIKAQGSAISRLAMGAADAWQRDPPTPIEEIQQREERARLFAAVQLLAERQRLAILMRLYHGYSTEETAALMGC
ncbi:MAG: sigma-70 family RNA polymerase sigma factor, partial [Bacillota bacterium]|nr:sigma-70 family RNA polymerase sigma factor [Bacillota bacterium]